MTYTKLFGFGLIYAAVLVSLKTWFYGSFTWADSFGLHAVYWAVVVVGATALVRRLGVITVIEAVVVMALWFIFELIGDVAVSGPVSGWGVLIDGNFLFGYFLLFMSVLLFHKKRHVQKRRQQAAA